jgi:hypothetical protein
MGTEYSCQTLESEEETVNKIFKDIFKKEFQPGSIYKHFLKCLVYNPNSKKVKISQNLLISFLQYAIEDNQCKEIYINFIVNLSKEKSEIDAIRKIGLFFIDLNTNKDSIRKKIYFKHFKLFYLSVNENNQIIIKENKSKVFLNKLNKIKQNKPLYLKYLDLKKDNKIENSSTISNSTEIQKKFLTSDNNIVFYFSNYIEEFDNEQDIGTKDKDFDFDFDLDFDNIFGYENQKNLNNTNFVNFYKKKEIEKLDIQINQLISDIIEINTDCLNSIIKEILSKKRGDFLKKSWGQNNKKLLLFQIYRNYTSLLDKVCLFMNKSSNKSNSPNQIKKENNLNHYPTHLLLNKETPRFSKHKSHGLIFNSKEINLNLISPYSTSNEKTKDDSDFKIKLKEEIIDFKKIENKIIKNFFDLSETQISGDAVRDWLYENRNID